MNSVIVEPEARAEIWQARDWYEAQRSGLGTEFVTELDRAISFAAEFPHACSVVARDARRALVRRFPYLVLFVARDDQVVVIGVFHTHRNPAVIRRRARRP